MEAFFISFLTSLGNDLTSISISPDKIPNNTRAGWIIFDLPDHEVTPGSTYYIVVKADGGDEKHYYSWHYINYNRYSDGKAYVSNDSGSIGRLRATGILHLKHMVVWLVRNQMV